MAGSGSPESLVMSTDELSYLPPPPDFLPPPEGLKEKFIRKTKENPFVPMGVAVTTFALSFGLWQLKTGNSKMSQKMMRLRIVGQGFTLVAVILGVAYGANKKPNN